MQHALSYTKCATFTYQRTISGRFFSVSQLLSRGTVGFHSGELSDIVSLFWLDCVPATGGTVVGVLLDDVQKKSVIFGNNNLPAN